MKIIRIAFVGADVSGKSSMGDPLRKALAEKNIGLVFVPEGATQVIKQYGVNPKTLNPGQYYKFQKLLFQTHAREEKLALENAPDLLNFETVVVAFDRGRMCCSGYMKPEDFQRLLLEEETNVVEVRDLSYDAVIHMVTAADGALAVYEKHVQDNDARHNRPADESIAVDKRIQNAWLGHSYLRVIDNSTDWPGKERRAIEAVLNAPGMPGKIEAERKFLILRRPDPALFPVACQPVEMRQTYLSDEPGHRVRKRWQENTNTVICYETRKLPTASPASSVELENRLRLWEYHQKKSTLTDPEREEIRKTRYYFVFKRQYCELDFYHAPQWAAGLTRLEVELTRQDDEVVVPGFLGDYREVTDDPNFKDYNIARKPA